LFSNFKYKNKTRIARMQQDIKQLTVILDGVDVSDPSQEKIASDRFIEEMKKTITFQQTTMLL